MGPCRRGAGRSGGGRRLAADAEPPRHEPQRPRLTGQRVGLQLVEQLQPVLDGAQMHERVRERAPELGRQVAALGQAEQGLERVPLAQPRVVAAVEQLQGLHDELDLADAAAPELDVAGAPVAGPAAGQLAVDLTLHPADRRDHGRVDTGAIDDFADQLHEPDADALVARRHPRLEQRLALPRRRPLAVVGLVALDRQREGADASLRAQPHVDPEDVALVGHRLDDLDDLAAHAAEVLAVGQAALARPRRLALRAVDEHEVDVGRVVQLLAAELAHADDGQRRLDAGVVARGAEAGARIGVRHAPGLTQAGVGQPGQLVGRHPEIGVTQQVAGTDAQQVAILEAAQRVHPRHAAGKRGQRLGQIRREVLGEPHPHRARLEEPGQRHRSPPECVGQELAGAAQAGQQMGGAGVRGQRAKQHGPIDDLGVPLEVVERHVRIGRRAQLGQQPRQRRRQQLRIPRRRRQRLEICRRHSRIRKSKTLESARPSSGRARQQFVSNHLGTRTGGLGGAVRSPQI